MTENIKNNRSDQTFPIQVGYWIAQFNCRTALVDGDNRFTYGQLGGAINKCCELFISSGLRKGDRAAVQMSNHAEFVTAVLSLLVMGVMPVLILPSQNSVEVEGIVKAAEPAIYICDSAGELSAKIAADNDLSCGVRDKAFFSEILSSAAPAASLSCADLSVKHDDVALFLLSGGTTGIPKLIPRTHGDYLYNARIISERMKLGSDSTFLAVIPMAHNFALANPGLLGTLLSGGKTVMCPDAAPIEMFSLIEEEKITYTCIVPAILKMCLEYRMIDDSDDLSSLELVLVGGAMLPEETARKTDSILGSKLIQVFGTAEGLICTNSPDDDFEVRVTSQGSPISEYDIIRIVDENGQDVPEGHTGELITKGPYTIHGYFKLKNNCDYFNNDGFYLTGDKAYITNGNIHIVGRAREQINRAGEKIMPSELEEMIQRHESVIDCAVVGAPDEILGQRISAFVTCRGPVDKDRLRQFLTDAGLASFKLPDDVTVLKSFPYTAAGKIDKKKLVNGL